MAVRLAQWRGQIAAGTSRIAVLPGLGFAQMGPQRDTCPVARPYPEDLYCLYLLARAQRRGLGTALLGAVRRRRAFTALVLQENAGACAFYEAAGGRLIDTRPDRSGDAAVTERVYGFAAPDADL